ncbi:MAG: AAA family ATPase [Bacteroidaceae bacterium]|nr:AAA family ATPase [Bacteroidaceae bacterium]
MIERIEIYNYKSIRESSVSLSPINILIGENGAGKSNFISFFELAKALYDQRLGSYMLSNGGMAAQLYRGLKHSKSIRGVIDYNNTNDFFFELKPGIGGEKAYIEQTGDYFNWSGEPNKDYSKWSKTIWDKAVEESNILEAKYPRAKYIRALLESFIVYHFHDTSKTSPMRQPCPLDDNASLRYDASNLPAVLYRLQQTDKCAFNIIEATVRSVAPYFKRFKLAPMSTDAARIKLEWEENDSDMYLDASAFSDGTLRFISLATLLLQSKLPDTIIIDEPELGLHPFAMVKLSSMIKRASYKAQIIIATQSVELINNFSIEDLIVVGRRDNQSTFHRLNETDFSHWLEEYSVGELWEKNIIGGRP